jgi:hypothetical protein
MGFEAFRVELRGGRAKYGVADEAVQKLPHIKPDQHSGPMEGSTFYILDDGQHVIEIELMDAPVRLSCRFTLCHPPSVDSVFLALLRELMIQLGMEAKIRDDVRPEHSRSFSLSEFAGFSAIISRYIAARRSEWIAAFGDEPMAAATSEVYQRVILPRCEPEIEQPLVTDSVLAVQSFVARAIPLPPGTPAKPRRDRPTPEESREMFPAPDGPPPKEK